MICAVSSFLFLVIVPMAVCCTATDPYTMGKYENQLINFSYGNRTSFGEGASEHIFVVTPKDSGTSEPLPVFVFITAYAGKVPAKFYLEFFQHIASHGVIVAGMDEKDASPTDKINYQPDLAKYVQSTVDWLKDGNMKDLLVENGATVSPDFSKLMIGGHSAGGHTITELLSDSGCHDYTGMVLLDPVDGLGPYNVAELVTKVSSVIHPPLPVNFQIPLLHLENLMDPLSPYPEKDDYPSCAPQDMSNDRFFDAWRGPAWQINATYYGHMDVVNMGYVEELNTLFDIFCAGNGSASNAEYISLTGGATVAFANMLYSPEVVDASGLPSEGGSSNEDPILSPRAYLENASLMPTVVQLRQNMNGHLPPYRGFCKEVAANAPVS